MTVDAEEQIGLPFLLYNYDHWFVAGKVHQLIELGQLPFDTFFRLASVGHKIDEAPDSQGYYLNFMLMHDIVNYVDTPEKMRPETKKVLWGERPDAIIDINSGLNYPAYSMLDTMYYRMADLAHVIRARRNESGQTLPETTYDRRLYTVQNEWKRCIGLARPIWRILVNRTHPEWLENPSDYYLGSYIGTFNVVYTFGEARKKRGIVGHSVFSDTLVKNLYEEARETGVRGIGRVGLEDLRLLLLEEHPELAEGHELPFTGNEN